MFDKKAIERFWAKVNKNSGYIAPHMDTECWEWTFYRDRGYGKLTVNGKVWRAHRFAYVLAYGGVEEGLLICHRCDNRKCVRPSHLFTGDALDNTRDMIAKGRGFVRDPSTGSIVVSPRIVAKVARIERVAKTEPCPWQPPNRDTQRKP